MYHLNFTIQIPTAAKTNTKIQLQVHIFSLLLLFIRTDYIGKLKSKMRPAKMHKSLQSKGSVFAVAVKE